MKCEELVLPVVVDKTIMYPRILNNGKLSSCLFSFDSVVQLHDTILLLEKVRVGSVVERHLVWRNVVKDFDVRPVVEILSSYLLNVVCSLVVAFDGMDTDMVMQHKKIVEITNSLVLNFQLPGYCIELNLGKFEFVRFSLP